MTKGQLPIYIQFEFLYSDLFFVILSFCHIKEINREIDRGKRRDSSTNPYDKNCHLFVITCHVNDNSIFLNRSRPTPYGLKWDKNKRQSRGRIRWYDSRLILLIIFASLLRLEMNQTGNIGRINIFTSFC